METTTVFELPEFDTGCFDKAEFLMANGGGQLSVHVSGLENIELKFEKLRWHQFTAQYNCTPIQIGAYFKLVEIVNSEQLAKYISEDTASMKAYSELHHFRIFLDEHGCHELFAESVNVT